MEKYFNSIVSDNIREFTALLNKEGCTKEDIVACFYNPSKDRYYAIIYR